MDGLTVGITTVLSSTFRPINGGDTMTLTYRLKPKRMSWRRPWEAMLMHLPTV